MLEKFSMTRWRTLVGTSRILCDYCQVTNENRVQTRHLGRNYLFGLNAEWTIDAALVGNETRFINHARGSLANCRAEGKFSSPFDWCLGELWCWLYVLLVREVNGDHRIGCEFSVLFLNCPIDVNISSRHICWWVCNRIQSSPRILKNSIFNSQEHNTTRGRALDGLWRGVLHWWRKR